MRIQLAVALIVAMLGVPTVFAQELVKSDPAADQVLDRPVRSVQLWFDQLPADVTATIEIAGDDSRVAVSGLHRMGNSSLMAMVPETLADGDYELAWNLGETSGALPFSIRRPAGYVEDHWEAPLDIGVVLYDGAEPLDVFGPLEMWMNLGPDRVRIHLIAEEARPIVLTTTSYPVELAPRLEAHYAFDDAPALDVLMVPGGIGTLVETENPAMIDFLRRAANEVAVATSVCTGSALYARAGVLEGVEATGNKVFFDYIVNQGPAVWREEARWVESGRFFTSSGVTAGIDMSLAVVARFFGEPVARNIAESTEYEWNEDPSRDPFVRNLNSAVPYVDPLRQRFEKAMQSFEASDDKQH